MILIVRTAKDEFPSALLCRMLKQDSGRHSITSGKLMIHNSLKK
jgi:hypothetical protein